MSDDEVADGRAQLQRQRRYLCRVVRNLRWQSAHDHVRVTDRLHFVHLVAIDRFIDLLIY